MPMNTLLVPLTSRYANMNLNQLSTLTIFFSILIPLATVAQSSTTSLDVQGHRGCRGLLPENTIPAFIKAVELGVTTLELDVVISQDQQVVVSHEPFLSHTICRDLNGEPITEEKEKEYNLYQMSYKEIAQCDCGSRSHPQFPEQQNFVAPKPLLKEVIDSVEQFIKAYNLSPVFYNIETKCTPTGDGTFHPEPDEFVDLLLSVIQENDIEERVIIQSFDVRTLQYTRKKHPSLALALLVGNNDSAKQNLSYLGFTPNFYSPHFQLVNEELINFAQQENMKVVPWTVNKPEDIQRMLDLNVDGIISDYPDRVITLTKD